MGNQGAKKRYDREFKIGAAKLVVEEGQKPGKVAKDLGVSIGSIHQWVKSYLADKGDAFPGSGNLKPQDEEIRKLKEELRITRMERDILKKTLPILTDRLR